MSTFSQFTNGNRIKSIQRGTISLSGATYPYATATIASVDTSKTELRMLGFSSTQNTAEPNTLFPSISLTSSTEITAYRTTTSSDATTVSWELTEFI